MSLDIGPNLARPLPDTQRPDISRPIGDPNAPTGPTITRPIGSPSDFEGSKLERPIGIGPRPDGPNDHTRLYPIGPAIPELFKDMGDAFQPRPGCAPSRPFTPDIERPFLDIRLPDPDAPPASIDDMIPGPNDPLPIVDYLIDYGTPPRMIAPEARIGTSGIYS